MYNFNLFNNSRSCCLSLWRFRLDRKFTIISWVRISQIQTTLMSLRKVVLLLRFIRYRPNLSVEQHNSSDIQTWTDWHRLWNQACTGTIPFLRSRWMKDRFRLSGAFKLVRWTAQFFHKSGHLCRSKLRLLTNMDDLQVQKDVKRRARRNKYQELIKIDLLVNACLKVLHSNWIQRNKPIISWLVTRPPIH